MPLLVVAEKGEFTSDYSLLLDIVICLYASVGEKRCICHMELCPFRAVQLACLLWLALVIGHLTHVTPLTLRG